MRGSTFAFDNVKPVAGITVPSGASPSSVRSLPVLSGTSSDDFAGVARVEISLQDVTGEPFHLTTAIVLTLSERWPPCTASSRHR